MKTQNLALIGRQPISLGGFESFAFVLLLFKVRLCLRVFIFHLILAIVANNSFEDTFGVGLVSFYTMLSSYYQVVLLLSLWLPLLLLFTLRTK